MASAPSPPSERPKAPVPLKLVTVGDCGSCCCAFRSPSEALCGGAHINVSQTCPAISL